jgi:hypothetical protein
MSTFTEEANKQGEAAKLLKPGKIIDVTQCDGSGERTIRRIKIKSATRNGGAYSVSGTNVQGKHPITYLVPVLPATGPNRKPNTTSWTPFDESGEADE